MEHSSKKTPLYDVHVANNAKMGDFAGFSMPFFYPLGSLKEHLHTRQSAGLFDISHMIHFDVQGEDAADFMAKVCPYDAHDQGFNAGRYSFMLNESGGIIDDLIVTRLAPNQYRIVANGACAEKDLSHLQTVAANFKVSVAHIPCGFIALQGPQSEAVLRDCGLDLPDMIFLDTHSTDSDWFISRSGYTGEDGFEVATPEHELQAFVEKLLSDDRVELIGLAARDTLRLESGLSLYGQDLSDEISPHEAGLIWAIPKSLRSEGTYIGAEAFNAKYNAGRKRKRLGMIVAGKAPVRSGVDLFDENDNKIGLVTSGGFGATLGSGIVLALVDADFSGTSAFAQVRNKRLELQKATLPFITQNYKRI